MSRVGATQRELTTRLVPGAEIRMEVAISSRGKHRREAGSAEKSSKSRAIRGKIGPGQIDRHARGSPQRSHLAWPCLIVTGHITHRLLGLLQGAAGSIGVDCPGWRLWSSHSTPTQTHPRTRMALIDFRPRREPRFHGCYFDIVSCYGASVMRRLFNFAAAVHADATPGAQSDDVPIVTSSLRLERTEAREDTSTRTPSIQTPPNTGVGRQSQRLSENRNVKQSLGRPNAKNSVYFRSTCRKQNGVFGGFELDREQGRTMTKGVKLSRDRGETEAVINIYYPSRKLTFVVKNDNNLSSRGER
ncbi:hypothetical protein BDFB_009400 [Asbolus verrucosus]|uniref:Uncharacterized protein n=1 Tax=Asbolus verrucosus TaxID=1661398 RepID=A0A482V407_ASBVE|nr:hypothetical protein BDFB_009400 [Asbolus verrucosus]